MRILVVPGFAVSLDLEEEQRQIHDAWKDIPGVEVVVLKVAEATALRQALLVTPFHILHFMGHGELDPATGQGILYLKGADDGQVPLSGDALATLLKDFRGLRLVFLNACETGRTPDGVDQDPYAGLATALVLGGLPTVLAMQLPVADHAAIAFSRTVYQRLAAGDPVDIAVTEGRQVLYAASPGTPEWAIPVLFTRAPDGRIFVPAGKAEPPELPAAPKVAAEIPESDLPSGKPWDERQTLLGRDRQLQTVLEHLEHPRRNRGIFSIGGLGGVGKTALAKEITHRLHASGLFAHVLWETAKTEELKGGSVFPTTAGPAITLERLLSAIAREGGFTADLEKKPTLAEKTRVAAAHLRRKRYLVVIDNLETIQDFRRLISDIDSLFSFSQAIVTTRHSLVEYDFVSSIQLRGLPKEAAVDLVRRELAERAPLRHYALSHHELDQIVRATGGLPLAIKLVISHVLSGAPLGELIAQLESVHVDWSSDQDDVYEEFYRFIYEAVFHGLSSPALELLGGLSELPQEQAVPVELVKAASGQTGAVFLRAIEELVRASLVDEVESEGPGAPSYALHPLTRNFIKRWSEE